MGRRNGCEVVSGTGRPIAHPGAGGLASLQAGRDRGRAAGYSVQRSGRPDRNGTGPGSRSNGISGMEWTRKGKRKGGIVHSVVSKRRRRSEEADVLMREAGWTRERGGRRTVGTAVAANFGPWGLTFSAHSISSPIQCRSTRPGAHAIPPTPSPYHAPLPPSPQHQGAGACAPFRFHLRASSASVCLLNRVPVELELPNRISSLPISPPSRVDLEPELEPRTANLEPQTPSRFRCRRFIPSPRRFHPDFSLGPTPPRSRRGQETTPSRSLSRQRRQDFVVNLHPFARPKTLGLEHRPTPSRRRIAPHLPPSKSAITSGMANRHALRR